ILDGVSFPAELVGTYLPDRAVRERVQDRYLVHDNYPVMAAKVKITKADHDRLKKSMGALAYQRLANNIFFNGRGSIPMVRGVEEEKGAYYAWYYGTDFTKLSGVESVHPLVLDRDGGNIEISGLAFRADKDREIVFGENAARQSRFSEEFEKEAINKLWGLVNKYDGYRDEVFDMIVGIKAGLEAAEEKIGQSRSVLDLATVAPSERAVIEKILTAQGIQPGRQVNPWEVKIKLEKALLQAVKLALAKGKPEWKLRTVFVRQPEDFRLVENAKKELEMLQNGGAWVAADEAIHPMVDALYGLHAETDMDVIRKKSNALQSLQAAIQAQLLATRPGTPEHARLTKLVEESRNYFHDRSVLLDPKLGVPRFARVYGVQEAKRVIAKIEKLLSEIESEIAQTEIEDTKQKQPELKKRLDDLKKQLDIESQKLTSVKLSGARLAAVDQHLLKAANYFEEITNLAAAWDSDLSVKLQTFIGVMPASISSSRDLFLNPPDDTKGRIEDLKWIKDNLESLILDSQKISERIINEISGQDQDFAVGLAQSRIPLAQAEMKNAIEEIDFLISDLSRSPAVSAGARLAADRAKEKFYVNEQVLRGNPALMQLHKEALQKVSGANAEVTASNVRRVRETFWNLYFATRNTLMFSEKIVETNKVTNSIYIFMSASEESKKAQGARLAQRLGVVERAVLDAGHWLEPLVLPADITATATVFYPGGHYGSIGNLAPAAASIAPYTDPEYFEAFTIDGVQRGGQWANKGTVRDFINLRLDRIQNIFPDGSIEIQSWDSSAAVYHATAGSASAELVTVTIPARIQGTPAEIRMAFHGNFYGKLNREELLIAPVGSPTDRGFGLSLDWDAYRSFNYFRFKYLDHTNPVEDAYNEYWRLDAPYDYVGFFNGIRELYYSEFDRPVRQVSQLRSEPFNPDHLTPQEAGDLSLRAFGKLKSGERLFSLWYGEGMTVEVGPFTLVGWQINQSQFELGAQALRELSRDMDATVLSRLYERADEGTLRMVLLGEPVIAGLPELEGWTFESDILGVAFNDLAGPISGFSVSRYTAPFTTWHTVTHEFTHLTKLVFSEAQDQAWWDLYTGASVSATFGGNYAAKNVDEMFAETATAYLDAMVPQRSFYYANSKEILRKLDGNILGFVGGIFGASLEDPSHPSLNPDIRTVNGLRRLVEASTGLTWDLERGESRDLWFYDRGVTTADFLVDLLNGQKARIHAVSSFVDDGQTKGYELVLSDGTVTVRIFKGFAGPNNQPLALFVIEGPDGRVNVFDIPTDEMRTMTFGEMLKRAFGLPPYGAPSAPVAGAPAEKPSSRVFIHVPTENASYVLQGVPAGLWGSPSEAWRNFNTFAPFGVAFGRPETQNYLYTLSSGSERFVRDDLSKVSKDNPSGIADLWKAAAPEFEDLIEKAIAKLDLKVSIISKDGDFRIEILKKDGTVVSRIEVGADGKIKKIVVGDTEIPFDPKNTSELETALRQQIIMILKDLGFLTDEDLKKINEEMLKTKVKLDAIEMLRASGLLTAEQAAPIESSTLAAAAAVVSGFGVTPPSRKRAGKKTQGARLATQKVTPAAGIMSQRLEIYEAWKKDIAKLKTEVKKYKSEVDFYLKGGKRKEADGMIRDVQGIFYENEVVRDPSRFTKVNNARIIEQAKKLDAARDRLILSGRRLFERGGITKEEVQDFERDPAYRTEIVFAKISWPAKDLIEYVGKALDEYRETLSKKKEGAQKKAVAPAKKLALKQPSALVRTIQTPWNFFVRLVTADLEAPRFVQKYFDFAAASFISPFYGFIGVVLLSLTTLVPLTWPAVAAGAALSTPTGVYLAGKYLIPSQVQRPVQTAAEPSPELPKTPDTVRKASVDRVKSISPKHEVSVDASGILITLFSPITIV
ncbi:MAG TPA: hypothetical protein VD883_01945, partial [Candidatus Omnitrophota bacterium]|nr:hypothetical protein [Candidatus Omnitrophota bacterium]